MHIFNSFRFHFNFIFITFISNSTCLSSFLKCTFLLHQLNRPNLHNCPAHSRLSFDFKNSWHVNVNTHINFIINLNVKKQFMLPISHVCIYDLFKHLIYPSCVTLKIMPLLLFSLVFDQ